MITTDVETIFVGIALADYAGLEVVAAWWSDGCIAGRVGGIWKGDSKGQR